MTIHGTVTMVTTVLSLAVAGTTTASAQLMLNNLEARLNGTGRVAKPELQGQARIPGTASNTRPPETTVRYVPGVTRAEVLARNSVYDHPDLGVAYGKAFAASVEDCRLDVARRRGVAPGEIAAGTLTLRWTIQPYGRVQDVSAFAWSVTNEEVTACAELVVASRALLSAVQMPAALEWTYAFRKLPADAREPPAVLETTPVQALLP